MARFRTRAVVVATVAIVAGQMAAAASGLSWPSVVAIGTMLIALVLAAGYATGLSVEAAAVGLPAAAVVAALTFRATNARASTLGAVVDLMQGFSLSIGHAVVYVAFILVVAFMLLRGPGASLGWWIIIAGALALLSIPFGWPPTFR